MKTVWKDVNGYEGLYKVSNTGKVMDTAGNEVRQVVTKSYRKEVRLIGGVTRQGTIADTKVKKVHRLVAESFLNLVYESGLDVDHINCNPTDNRLYNLRIVTKSDNYRYYTETKYEMSAVQKYRNEDQPSVSLEEFKGYSVSKDGKLFKEGKEININKRGGVRVDGDSYLINRLVASAYLIQPFSNCNVQILHKDRNKLNNHYKNLFFCPDSLFRYTMDLNPKPLKVRKEFDNPVIYNTKTLTKNDSYATLHLTETELFHLIHIINKAEAFSKERKEVIGKLGNTDNYIINQYQEGKQS